MGEGDPLRAQKAQAAPAQEAAAAAVGPGARPQPGKAECSQEHMNWEGDVEHAGPPAAPAAGTLLK